MAHLRPHGGRVSQSWTLTPGCFLCCVLTVLLQKDPTESNKIQDENTLPGTSLARARVMFWLEP